jgi:sucrose phosphorylase
MFMPGIPQVWYLDIFAGTNNYAAADNGGSAGHKEINRTTLTMNDVEQGLKTEVVKKQLEIMHLRNTSNAFSGHVEINDIVDTVIDIKWVNGAAVAHIKADLLTNRFTIEHSENGMTSIMSF